MRDSGDQCVNVDSACSSHRGTDITAVLYGAVSVWVLMLKAINTVWGGSGICPWGSEIDISVRDQEDYILCLSVSTQTNRQDRCYISVCR